MRLLLRNLLDNALRHGAGALQPPEVHLRADAQQPVITVRDHGPGVPEDQLPAWHRPSTAPTPRAPAAQGGVGLGLLPVQAGGQAHGGTIDLRNAMPGLAVTVCLPAQQP
jgi:signal transduction histidine kinase